MNVGMYFYKCTNLIFHRENQVEKTPSCAYSSNTEVFKQSLSIRCKQKLSHTTANCTSLKLMLPGALTPAITWTI